MIIAQRKIEAGGFSALAVHTNNINTNFTSSIAFAEIQHFWRPIQAFVQHVSHFTTSLASLYSASLQAGKNNTDFGVMLISKTFNTYNSSNMYMEMARLQYGQHMFNYQQGQRNCFDVSFDHVMPAVPSVKLQPVVRSVLNRDELIQSMLTAWLVNVTKSGFMYCVSETIPFVDVPSNMTVNYVAVCGALTDNMALIQNHRLAIYNNQCVNHTFGHSEYLNKPYVFVTAESSNRDLPLVAWVRSSSQNGTEVCVRAACNDAHTSNIHAYINVIVRGDINPCKSFVPCPNDKECRVDIHGKPYCACVDACPTVTGQSVCGSDNKTYASECHMQVYNCKNNTSVTKKHDGVCVRKLFFKSFFLN